MSYRLPGHRSNELTREDKEAWFGVAKLFFIHIPLFLIGACIIANSACTIELTTKQEETAKQDEDEITKGRKLFIKIISALNVIIGIIVLLIAIYNFIPNEATFKQNLATKLRTFFFPQPPAKKK